MIKEKLVILIFFYSILSFSQKKDKMELISDFNKSEEFFTKRNTVFHLKKV